MLFPVGLHLIETVAKWWIWIFFSGLHNHVNDLFHYQNLIYLASYHLENVEDPFNELIILSPFKLAKS